jgi:hypothetical protein
MGSPSCFSQARQCDTLITDTGSSSVVFYVSQYIVIISGQEIILKIDTT